ncbi:MAG: Sec-independent protein translocase protein TatB [Tepidiformaceae bacterium]
MEFLGVGYQELLLVLVLMLVVVGPERLPAVAYQIGRWVRQMQRYARAVRDEFSDEIGYIEEQYRAVKGEVDTTRQTLREQQVKFAAEMRETTAELDGPLLPAEAAGTNIVAFNSGAVGADVEDGSGGVAAAGENTAGEGTAGAAPAEGAAAKAPPLVF